MPTLNFGQEQWEIQQKYISDYDNNLGPLTWSTVNGKVSINPKADGEDADQIGVIINGSDDINIKSDRANMDVPINSFIIDKQTINTHSTTQASSTITPIQLFSIDDPEDLFMLNLYYSIYKLIADIKEEEKYPANSLETIYKSEIIDYDDFLPE